MKHRKISRRSRRVKRARRSYVKVSRGGIRI